MDEEKAKTDRKWREREIKKNKGRIERDGRMDGQVRKTQRQKRHKGIRESARETDLWTETKV